MSRDTVVDSIAIHDWGEHPCPPAVLRDHLDGLDCEVEVVGTTDLPEYDAVVTLFHHDGFVDAVQWVHTIRSGYDDFPLAAYREAGVTVTNSTGVAGDLVAETVTGFLVMLAKGLHRYRDRQREADWQRLPWRRPFDLRDSTACVVGVGELGGSVAARAGVLGMAVTGVDVRPVSVLGLDRVYDVTNIEKAVSDARFVVLTTPLTETTRGLVDRTVLDAMDEAAYLVNVSRGAVVDQDALVDALERDEIAGAALDVFDEEPLPANSPLWDMPDVVVTPHAAAQSKTYGQRIARLVETNVSRLNAGLVPWNEVV